jgi:hypothetical protein
LSATGRTCARGDVISFAALLEDHIVQRSDLHRAPGGRLAYRSLKVIPISEWSAKRDAEAARAPAPQIVQHIHNAQNVAGRDVRHMSTTNITVVQLLSALERAVQDSASIPAEEKTSLIDRIRGLALNPYISGLATTGIVELVKAALGAN